MLKKNFKNVQQKFMIFYYLGFLCKFSKVFSNFELIYHVYFFGELPTIAGHQVTQVYSRQIPLKVEIIHG